MAVGEFSQVLANSAGAYVFFQPTGSNVFLILSCGCEVDMEIELYAGAPLSQNSLMIYRGARTSDVKINAMFGKFPIDNTNYVSILSYSGLANVGMVHVA